MNKYVLLATGVVGLLVAARFATQEAAKVEASERIMHQQPGTFVLGAGQGCLLAQLAYQEPPQTIRFLNFTYRIHNNGPGEIQVSTAPAPNFAEAANWETVLPGCTVDYVYHVYRVLIREKTGKGATGWYDVIDSQVR